jgi:hypothetical protein
LVCSYEVMRACWRWTDTERPSFGELEALLTQVRGTKTIAKCPPDISMQSELAPHQMLLAATAPMVDRAQFWVSSLPMRAQLEDSAV